jgi:hypothetical protein
LSKGEEKVFAFDRKEKQHLRLKQIPRHEIKYVPVENEDGNLEVMAKTPNGKFITIRCLPGTTAKDLLELFQAKDPTIKSNSSMILWKTDLPLDFKLMNNVTNVSRVAHSCHYRYIN